MYHGLYFFKWMWNDTVHAVDVRQLFFSFSALSHLTHTVSQFSTFSSVVNKHQRARYAYDFVLSDIVVVRWLS